MRTCSARLLALVWSMASSMVFTRTCSSTTASIGTQGKMLQQSYDFCDMLIATASDCGGFDA